jgi:nickel-dependent lactate racemase
VNIIALRCGAPPETTDTLPLERLRCEAVAPSVEKIAKLAIDALQSPLGLPPLAQCVTPDDRIAIAVGHGLPAAGPLVSGAIAALAAAGIDRRHIKVVTASIRDAVPLEEALSHEVASGVLVESHDPSGEDTLCFAGLAKGDKPLLVNRTVFEADVVLPISAEATTGDIAATDEAGGAYDGLFPDFFDRETIERFRRVRTVNDASVGGARQSARRAAADQAGWIVGAPLVLRAVPGPGGGVARVLAGDPEQVTAAAANVSREAWQTPLAEPADVVLAVISGGADQQTWSSIGKALAAAERLVRSGGVIAVWSELAEPIGERLGLLAEADDPDELAAALAAESGDEALAAWRVLQALQNGPVFLRSLLDPDEVEPLGIAPVADIEELQRLVNRFEDCTVLEEAQHVRFADVVINGGESLQ